MIAVVKSVCIFMIIAQAVLMLVPGSSYMKYVKVLAGILMILMISNPIVLWFGKGEEIAIEEILQEIENGAPKEQKLWKNGEGNMGIYSSIEEEIKYKLNISCEDESYYVKEVKLNTLKQDGEREGEAVIESLLITVEEQKEPDSERIYIEPVKVGKETTSLKEVTRLRQKYGDCIGIDPERIEIRTDHG